MALRLSLLGSAALGAAGRRISVGAIDDTFHQVESAVVAQVLRRRCLEVDFTVLGHSEAFEALLNGSIDLLPSVWLPSGHASYLADAVRGRDYELLGTTSEEGVFFWVVSAALSASVTSIDDLADPGKTEGMHPQICGPIPDSGLSFASIKITEALNERRRAANSSAVALEYVPDMESYQAFLANPPADKYACAFWVPNRFNAQYRTTGQVVRISSGSFGETFGYPNRGVTLASGAFTRAGVLSGDDLSAIARIFIGNTAINEMDLKMQTPNACPLDIAAEMMDQAEYAYWFDPATNCTGSEHIV